MNIYVIQIIYYSLVHEYVDGNLRFNLEYFKSIKILPYLIFVLSTCSEDARQGETSSYI